MDGRKIIGGFLVVAAIVIGSILALANKYTEYQCREYTRVTGTETKYVNLDSCYVLVDGKFQRWEEYLQKETASAGLKAR